jgi:hypothetical protein
MHTHRHSNAHAHLQSNSLLLTHVFDVLHNQGCAWHMLKACYSNMVRTQVPENLRGLVISQIKATIMAAVVSEFEVEMAKLLSLLGQNVPSSELRKSMCSSAVLPSAVGDPAAIGHLSEFGAYFRRQWIDGGKGRACVKEKWAMAYRTVELHGVIKSCNMIAENGNRKINAAKKLAPPGADHVSFIKWLLLWMVEACIAPVVFSKKGWYVQSVTCRWRACH